MGIDAFIESEDGEPRGEVPDPGDLTAKLASSLTADSRCVCFIDPYGDTTFNQLQIPVLIKELERAIDLSPDPLVKSHGEALLALAHRANSEVHTYVKFYGD
jgi:hypothetical protein